MIMVERPGCCPALIGAIVQGEYCVAKLPNPDHWLRRNWKKKTWFLMNPSYIYEGAAIITFGVLQHPILHSIALKPCYKVCDQKQKLKLKVFLRLDRDVSGQNIPFIHNMSDFDFFGPALKLFCCISMSVSLSCPWALSNESHAFVYLWSDTHVFFVYFHFLLELLVVIFYTFTFLYVSTKLF